MDPGWKRISVVLTLTRLPRGRQPDLAMVPRPFGWVYNTPLPERTTGLRNLASQLGALRRIISWSGGFLDGAAQSRLRSNFLNVFSTALLSQPSCTQGGNRGSRIIGIRGSRIDVVGAHSTSR